MAKKSATKNYIYNLMYQVLVMIIPFITTPYLARTLGAEKLGIYSYTISITTYFILAGTLGIAMYGQREIAYVQDNVKKRSNVFYEILFLRFITLSISMASFFLAFCIGRHFSVYYRILLIEMFANAFDISWFFQGMEEFKKTVFRNLIVKIVATILIFILVKSQNDLKIYIFIYVLSNLLGNLSLWLYLPKFIEKVDFKKLKIQRHLKPTIQLFIPQLATQLYTILDKSMLGYLIIDKSEVEFYEQSQKLVKLVLTLCTSLGTVMVPRMASTYAKGDMKRLKGYMNTSLSFILMLALPLTFGLVSIIDDFVPKFYGPGFDKVSLLIKVICPIIIFISVSNVLGTQYLLPTKQQKKFTISVVCGALTNLILNLIFIPKYASLGASISTVVAELVVTAVQLIIVKEFSTWDVIKVGYKYFIASVIMFFVSKYVGSLINNAYASMGYQVVISAFVYFGLLILMKDKFLQELKERVEWLLNNITSNMQKKGEE